MLFWIRSLCKLRSRLWLTSICDVTKSCLQIKCQCYSFLIRKYTRVCCGPRGVRLCHSCTCAAQQDWMLNLRLWGEKVSRYPHLYNLSLKLYKGNEIEINQEWNLAGLWEKKNKPFCRRVTHPQSSLESSMRTPWCLCCLQERLTGALNPNFMCARETLNTWQLQTLYVHNSKWSSSIQKSGALNALTCRTSR